MNKVIVFIGMLALANFRQQECSAACCVGDDASTEDYWSSFSKIAGRLMDLGRFDQAEVNFARALDFAERNFPANDERRILSHRDLAYIKARKGDIAGAEPHATRALELYEKLDEQDDTALAKLLELRGGLLIGLKRFAEADALLERSLRLYEKAQGPDEPNIASILVALSETRRLLHNRLEESEALARRAVAVTEKAPRPIRREFLPNCLETLAAAVHAQGKDEEAAELLRQAIAIQEQSRGRDHPDLVAMLADLANLERDGGKPAEAEAKYRRAIEIGKDRLVRMGPAMHRAYAGYSALLRKSGRTAEAEAMEREVSGKDSR